MNDSIHEWFSASYIEARARFHAAAHALDVAVASDELDSHAGALGETLSIDHVLVAPPDARALLIVTSGTHGVEGFAGSGCQIGMLRDAGLLATAAARKVALLVVHAVNPYGFSHLRRVNEDNIDLNRNFVDFSRPLPSNPDYRDIHALLLPESWPPSAENLAAIEQYCATHGKDRFRRAVSGGQYEVADGMFYGGAAPSWSHRTVRAIFRRHLPNFERIAMIDVHTGLGAHGHGEKIFVGRTAPGEKPRADAFWGSDVLAPASAGSAAVPVSGPIVALAYEEAGPGTDVTTMALEFGTRTQDEVRNALRGDHWLSNRREVAPALAYAIKRRLRDAFYCDRDSWKGMLFGQFRTAVLQAAIGLGEQRAVAA